MVDWSLFIPPAQLPPVPKAHHAGQIIGFANNWIRAVCLVREDADREKEVQITLLAGGSTGEARYTWHEIGKNYHISGNGALSCDHAARTVIIQDVGQEAPTDPDLIYQFLYK